VSPRPLALSNISMKRDVSTKEWVRGGTPRSRDKPTYGDPEKPISGKRLLLE